MEILASFIVFVYALNVLLRIFPRRRKRELERVIRLAFNQAKNSYLKLIEFGYNMELERQKNEDMDDYDSNDPNNEILFELESVVIGSIGQTYGPSEQQLGYDVGKLETGRPWEYSREAIYYEVIQTLISEIRNSVIQQRQIIAENLVPNLHGIRMY